MKKILEAHTPLDAEIDGFISGLAGRDGIDAILLEECGGVSVITAAEKLRQNCDKEIIIKIACRDRNRIALRSLIVTAASAGFMKLLFVDGVHPIRTAFPEAKPVYEFDSLGLLRVIKHGSPEFGPGDDFPPAASEWTIGACIGGATRADMARAKKFLEAGADMLFTLTFEGIRGLRKLTERPIFLCVEEAETADMKEAVEKAESAGANGINLVIPTSGRASYGNVIATG